MGYPEQQDSLKSVIYNNDDAATDVNANNLKYGGRAPNSFIMHMIHPIERHQCDTMGTTATTRQDVKSRLLGFQRICCHLIFNVKMDFTRKARFVAGGHVTDPPECLTYSSVVSCETVRIAFLLAALNDLDICAADIGNAYLNVNCA